MWLNLIIVIACVNSFLGFLGYGMYNASLANSEDKPTNREGYPLLVDLFAILFVIILSVVFGFWVLSRELKSGSYKYGLRYLE